VATNGFPDRQSILPSALIVSLRIGINRKSGASDQTLVEELDGLALMMERKMVLSRRGKLLTLFFFAVALASAVLASLNLAAAFFPASTMQVPVEIVRPPEQPISYTYGFPELSFQIPAVEPYTTLRGNVTLCCLSHYPNTQCGYIAPELFVFTDNQYVALKGETNPSLWNAPSEASIKGDTFRNYTLNGPAGTETLLIQFSIKENSVYYVLVESHNGETQGDLYLTYYKSEIVENPWVSRFQWGFRVLSILGLIGGAYEGYRTLKAPEEKIQWHPRQLLSKVHESTLVRSKQV
jgi:hypothetical protein